MLVILWQLVCPLAQASEVSQYAEDDEKLQMNALELSMSDFEVCSLLWETLYLTVLVKHLQSSRAISKQMDKCLNIPSQLWCHGAVWG